MQRTDKRKGTKSARSSKSRAQDQQYSRYAGSGARTPRKRAKHTTDRQKDTAPTKRGTSRRSASDGSVKRQLVPQMAAPSRRPRQSTPDRTNASRRTARPVKGGSHTANQKRRANPPVRARKRRRISERERKRRRNRRVLAWTINSVGILCAAIFLLLIFRDRLPYTGQMAARRLFDTVSRVTQDSGATEADTERSVQVEKETEKQKPRPKKKTKKAKTAAKEPKNLVPTGNLIVDVIDVGQGTAVLLQCEGESAMFDCGATETAQTVQTFLADHDIGALKYLFLSTGAGEHIGGAAAVVSSRDVYAVYMPTPDPAAREYENLINEMRFKNMTWQIPSTKETYYLGAASLQILDTPKAEEDGKTVDTVDSLTMMVRYGDKAFILTGDGDSSERAIAAVKDPKADVLLCGDHGNNTATSWSVLSMVKPSYAVLSTGMDEEYVEHTPATEVLARLEGNGINALRTDQLGSIRFVTNGTDLTYEYTGGVGETGEGEE